jgi:hypothetical protein
MTRARAVVLLFIAVIATVAALLPVVRDELSWWWADSHDHAADFMNYLTVWPKGRHAAEARLKHHQRQWVEMEEGMIHQAYQEASHSSPQGDAEYRREKRLRQDAFFWKEATNSNTLESYQDYLQQFPGGQFARQARAQIYALGRRSKGVPPVSSPSPQ